MQIFLYFRVDLQSTGRVNYFIGEKKKLTYGKIILPDISVHSTVVQNQTNTQGMVLIKKKNPTYFKSNNYNFKVLFSELPKKKDVQYVE